jgi:phosphohistidine phosphatase
MHLYLVQHGTAVPKDEDPARPLSDSGRLSIQKAASFLARSQLDISGIVHSGKLRAAQTALLLAETLGPGRVVEECLYPIGPNDSIDLLYDAIESGPTEQIASDKMVVGHLPFLSKLLSRLVCGDELETVVHFRPGTIVALERGGNGDGWSIDWVLKPELLGG